MFTILHLSDLHRSAEDPISNPELLSSLIADCHKYGGETPACPMPDAIVVSGDLVQGVPLGAPDAHEKLTDQYRVATEFLLALVDEFLGGDRVRLVMVPGNHDVDWNAALAAMKPTAAADMPENVGPKTFSANSPLRWSWRDRAAFSIASEEEYELRLAAFRTFYADFYADTPRRLQINPNAYWDLFELHDGRIVIAAFNSCRNNDCFRMTGQIRHEDVAAAHLEIEKVCGNAELRMAVWHHNIDGAPESDDYMDVATVHRLIGDGFRVGLHGHQHRSEASYRHVQLPEEERMAVVSAGSLCAGQIERPTGVNRQYNVIVLSDDLGSARVHIREMAVATVFGPSMRAELGGKGHVDLSWDTVTFVAQVAKATRGREADALVAAEAAWKTGDLAAAKTLLAAVDLAPGSFGRALLRQVLEQDEQWGELDALLGDPTTIEELTSVVKCRVRLGAFDEARDTLARSSGDLGLPVPQRHDLEAFITAQEASA